MFNHLLVPVDGSPVSDRLIGEAIHAALRGGARITFFNASGDFSQTSDGALAHAAWPAAFKGLAQSHALTILAKAEAAAKAAGVPCHAVAKTHPRPHEAIFDAAIEGGCDVIFIASRGGGAMTRLLHRSVTQRLLEISTLPVLVARGHSGVALSDAEQALAIVRDEHRSLAAVLNVMKDLLARAKLTGQIDVRLVRAILYYIEKFPEQLHHPKEEAYIFAKLRIRAPEYGELLDGLEKEHAQGGLDLQAMREALQAFESSPEKGLARFADAAGAFVEGQFRHMSLEEQALPVATRTHLTAEDWRDILRAFTANEDPRFGAESDEPFDHLLGRLIALAQEQTAPTGDQAAC